jgi:hypothetical protein
MLEKIDAPIGIGGFAGRQRATGQHQVIGIAA